MIPMEESRSLRQQRIEQSELKVMTSTAYAKETTVQQMKKKKKEHRE